MKMAFSLNYYNNVQMKEMGKFLNKNLVHTLLWGCFFSVSVSAKWGKWIKYQKRVSFFGRPLKEYELSLYS